jgi:hypothetical protein
MYVKHMRAIPLPPLCVHTVVVSKLVTGVCAKVCLKEGGKKIERGWATHDTERREGNVSDVCVYLFSLLRTLFPEILWDTAR